MGRLIVISGLPGVGKTSAAVAVAGRIGAVHLSIDAIEESILACGLPVGRQVGVASYEAARAVAELNLRLGHRVVVDAVNDSELARQTWRAATNAADADLLFVHLVVSDPSEHERRVRDRQRGFNHVPEPTWEEVLVRRDECAPWLDEHIELDTAALSVEEIVDEVIAQTAS
ncbi:AAA family ATPase [Georgenia sp. M64]|uniref:AAA family ATPase n=1 Tax=Georgenia sp. M64 TaxID=3120520 RepID=UPI0030E26B66